MLDHLAGPCRRLRAGDPIILYDEVRDEGDLVAAATSISDHTVNTMVTAGRGLLSVVVTPARCDTLGLCSMPVQRAGGRRICDRTPTLRSVDSRSGITSGISAYDRARTILTVADPATEPSDLVCPGHIFPLVAPGGGVREERGRLGAAVDLLRLAGIAPVAAVCDVLDDQGALAGVAYLTAMADSLGLPIVTVGRVAQAMDDDGLLALRRRSSSKALASVPGSAVESRPRRRRLDSLSRSA